MRIPGLFRFGASRLQSARLCKTKAGGERVKALPPCPPSYDDLPEPIGDWESHNSARQMKYNLQLGASVLFFIATIATVKLCGIFHLNYYPPEKPNLREC